MKISDTQKRILEIKDELANNHAGFMNVMAPQPPYVKEGLLAELNTLETKERFESSKNQMEINLKQAQISFWVGLGSIVIGLLAVIASVIIASYYPQNYKNENISTSTKTSILLNK